MKLVFRGLKNLELPITSQSIGIDSNGKYSSASFSITGKIPLAAGKKLTGGIDMMSDDDMMLNSFKVSDFLRYEITDDDKGNCQLYLTQSPVPVPPPPPPPPVPPTPEEILAQAKYGKAEMLLSARDSEIRKGVDVTTAYGVEHFNLESKDQTLLLGIYSMVKSGLKTYPYHSVNTDASANICEVYTDADIAKIATAAFAYITYNESYANIMTQWLIRETDPTIVYGITYGATLPIDLQNYLDMILTSAGIDPALFAKPVSTPDPVVPPVTPTPDPVTPPVNPTV